VAESLRGDIDQDGFAEFGDIDAALLEIGATAHLTDRVVLRCAGTVGVPPANLRAFSSDVAFACHKWVEHTIEAFFVLVAAKKDRGYCSFRNEGVSQMNAKSEKTTPPISNFIAKLFVFLIVAMFAAILTLLGHWSAMQIVAMGATYGYAFDPMVTLVVIFWLGLTGIFFFNHYS
jgi:hypothetical protein